MKIIALLSIGLSFFSGAQAFANFEQFQGDMQIQSKEPTVPLVSTIDLGIGIVLNNDNNCGAFENGVLTLPFTTDQFPKGPSAVKMTNRASGTVLVRFQQSVEPSRGGDISLFVPVISGNVHQALPEELHGADGFGVISLDAGETIFVVLPTVDRDPSLFTQLSMSCKTPESMIKRPLFSYGARYSFGTWHI